MSETDLSTELEPRVEAKPVGWSELTEQQRRAAEAVHKLLRYQAKHGAKVSRFAEREAADSDALVRVLPPIETERWARVCMIEGDRGSGKTGLLISLIHHWNRLARRQASHFDELTAEPGHVIVPIGLFDLRTLPKRAALKVHLAAMLRRLYEYVAGGMHDPVPLPTSPHPHRDSLEQAWTNFVSATAADEVEFAKRAPMVDPETFAEEIHAAESERFDLTALFCRLIDLLVERYPRAKSEVPVFVIAIDDVDMSPEGVMECLELTQTFTHPRVAYLLTGHEQLCIAVLEKHFRAHVNGDGRGQEQARQLAWKFYEKCVPPQQRARLFTLSPEERVEHLRQELKQIALPVSRTVWRKDTVADIMTAFPMLAVALPETMREVVDLKAQLQHRRPDQAPLHVAELFWRLLEIQRKYASDAEREVLDPIYKERQGMSGRVTEIRVGHIRVVPKTRKAGELLHFGTFNGGRSPFTKMQIDRYAIEEFRPVLTGPAGESEGPRATILLAALTLTGHGLEESAVFTRPEVIVVEMHRRTDVVRTVWPLPQWQAIQWLEFARCWASWVENLAAEKQATDPDAIARAYVASCTSLHLAKPEQADAGIPSWEKLIEDAIGPLLFESAILLAAPESGLPAQTRQQILDARKLCGTDEYRRTNAAYLRQQRASILPTAHRDWIRDAFGEEDPWYVEIEYTDEHLSPLASVLDEPLVCKNPWAETLGAYLTDDLRHLLRKDIDAVEQLFHVLNTNRHTDERARLAKMSELLFWNNTRLNSEGTVHLDAASWYTSEDVEVRGDKYSYSLATGSVSWAGAQAPLANQVAFLLAHDLAADRQADWSRLRNDTGWPLFQVERLTTGSISTPWPMPTWVAHIDWWLCAVGWNDITNDVQFSPEHIGDAVRAYIQLQIDVFRRRRFDTRTVPQWGALIERVASVVVEMSMGAHHRAEIFERWTRRLRNFLYDQSMLPDLDKVALATALRSVEKLGTDRDLPEILLRLMQRSDERVAAANKGDAISDSMLEFLRQEYEPLGPEHFAAPAPRREAADLLIGHIERLSKPSILTEDLRGWIRDSPLAPLEAVTNALLGAETTDPVAALFVARRAAQPQQPREVLLAGGQLVVKARYQVDATFSEPGENETEIPGLTVRYFRGMPGLRQDRLLAEVLTAVLHDLSRESSQEQLPPVQWPLVSYTARRLPEVTPWPQVQWPLRADLYQQIAGWHACLDHRSSTSLTAVAREYIWMTTNIYEFGRYGSGYPGSWQDVLTRAWTLRPPTTQSARDAAYHAWTDQLVRFALPRVGFSSKYAADIIVRLWDINGLDPRPELVGRINQFRQNHLALPIPPDHPAQRLADEKSEDLTDFMNHLRSTYELG